MAEQLKKYKEEWSKFVKWCYANHYNRPIRGELAYMNKEAAVACLVNFGKVKIVRVGDIEDADFEEILEEEDKNEENNGSEN